MTKKIYPGNYVNPLSAYQSQGIVSIPGRLFVHRVGYIKVDSTPPHRVQRHHPQPRQAAG